MLMASVKRLRLIETQEKPLTQGDSSISLNYSERSLFLAFRLFKIFSDNKLLCFVVSMIDKQQLQVCVGPIQYHSKGPRTVSSPRPFASAYTFRFRIQQ